MYGKHQCNERAKGQLGNAGERGLKYDREGTELKSNDAADDGGGNDT